MNTEDIVSVVLAAGRGRRMGTLDTHKVCQQLQGTPVITRALRMYEECGIDRHIVVVGHMAEDVKGTLEEFAPAVDFALQANQKGTGHAAKCGAALLQEDDYTGFVFVVAGDKVLKKSLVSDLIAAAQDNDTDLIFVTGNKADNPGSGRVVKDSQGNPAAIVETSEVSLSEFLEEMETLVAETDQPISSDFLVERMKHYFPKESKRRQACAPLHEMTDTKETVSPAELDEVVTALLPKVQIEVPTVDGTEVLRAHKAEELTDEVNLSVYLFRAEALYEGLQHLEPANAQGEEYLTDVVKYLASVTDDTGDRRYKIETLRTSDPTDAMGFNTPQELQKIRDYYANRSISIKSGDRAGTQKLPANTWRKLFTNRDPRIETFLELTYGDDRDLWEDKRTEYLTALEHYATNYNADDEVFIVRSPGRINLMGRHIDHRGGNVNVIAISDECLAVVSESKDDRIELSNSMPDRFADDSFSIQQMVQNLELSDWFTCVNSPKTLALVNDGDWDNYIKAATLRLQEKFSDRTLKGMKMTVHSNVPIGSGLSSSSAIVVAAAEACVKVNELPVQPHLLVDLCGEGEWFVGTRGGSGDHAAIKLGRRGEVANMTFFPFRVKGFVPFPDGYRILIIDSGIEAKKMQGARAEYNNRVLAYVAGEILFKAKFPQYADQIEHLRDISPENIGVEEAEMYSMLRHIPRTVTQAELKEMMKDMPDRDRERVAALLATELPEEDPLYVRDILMYGLAEIKRSRLCSEYLKNEDLEGFGRLCFVSHDGDRVAKFGDALKPRVWNYEVSDEYLQKLIKARKSFDPAVRNKAQLEWQPGRYACSVPTIDMIVDMARQMDGVLGAQIAGAGLGGCAMAFVREDYCDEVSEKYGERGFETRLYSPVQGAGIVTLP